MTDRVAGGVYLPGGVATCFLHRGDAVIAAGSGEAMRALIPHLFPPPTPKPADAEVRALHAALHDNL